MYLLGSNRYGKMGLKNKHPTLFKPIFAAPFQRVGTNVRGDNVIVFLFALAAWTKTLTFNITFKPLNPGMGL